MPEVRLIDANALLKKCIEGDGDNKFTKGYNFAVQEISAYITLAPTIEPEVRHGRWAYGYNSEAGMLCHFCTVCGNEAYWDTDYGQQLFKFCPNCGAYMREGGADNG